MLQLVLKCLTGVEVSNHVGSSCIINSICEEFDIVLKTLCNTVISLCVWLSHKSHGVVVRKVMVNGIDIDTKFVFRSWGAHALKEVIQQPGFGVPK